MKLPKKKEIISAYGKVNEKGKELLTLLFPNVKSEHKSITKRVKTFEDACDMLGKESQLVATYTTILTGLFDKNLIAYVKLRIICEALNESWDVRTKPEGWYVEFCRGLYVSKFYPLIYKNASSIASSMYPNIGSRLVFKSKELADYCAKQFADLWRDYFIE